MNEQVFIAGKGIISAIGNNVAECLDALQNERAGMGQMQQLKSAHSQRLPVAEVKLSNDELAKLAGLPNIKSRTALLSLIAAKEAIADAGINLSKLQSFPIPGSNWLYSFHADMEFDSVQQFNKLVKNILPLTNHFKVYGIYKMGETK